MGQGTHENILTGILLAIFFKAGLVHKTIQDGLQALYAEYNYSYVVSYTCFFTHVILIALVEHFNVYIYYHLILLKNLHVFNFHAVRVPTKIFNLENFPNYGNALQK